MNSVSNPLISASLWKGRLCHCGPPFAMRFTVRRVASTRFAAAKRTKEILEIDHQSDGGQDRKHGVERESRGTGSRIVAPKIIKSVHSGDW
jgi:hypothetical protein